MRPTPILISVLVTPFPSVFDTGAVVFPLPGVVGLVVAVFLVVPLPQAASAIAITIATATAEKRHRLRSYPRACRCPAMRVSPLCTNARDARSNARFCPVHRGDAQSVSGADREVRPPSGG